MILTRSETSIQLTYSLEEFKEFNHTLVKFRNEITGTLRNKVPDLRGEDKEYFETLRDEFIHTLDYIDHTMFITRTAAGLQLTFGVQEYEKFDNNLGFLRYDLDGFQEWYNSKGEYEKVDALENIHKLIDIFIPLLGNKIIDNRH